jgi:hypothetical protein
MILCCIIGYAVYGSLMMNYTLRGQDKAVTILLLSCIFLACMNAFVALLVPLPPLSLSLPFSRSVSS